MLLEGEDIKTLLAVQYRLENTGLGLLSPSVQAIIGLRLHDEQIASSQKLRESMETVSDTLVEVERLQRRVERAGVFVGFVGLILAAIQVWATLHEGFAH